MNNKLAKSETTLFKEASYMTVSPVFKLYIPYLIEK